MMPQLADGIAKNNVQINLVKVALGGKERFSDVAFAKVGNFS